MASDADNLRTIRSNLLTALATESVNPKPNYTIDGRSYSWSDWRSKILADCRELSDQIAMLDPNGPVIVMSQVE